MCTDPEVLPEGPEISLEILNITCCPAHIFYSDLLYDILQYMSRCWGKEMKPHVCFIKKKEKENPTEDQNVSVLVIFGEQRVGPSLEWLEVKILVIICVQSPILLSYCTPKQCHLVFYILAICQFFPCLLKFNKSRNGSETTFRDLSEHYADSYSLLVSQFSLRWSQGKGRWF